MKGFNQDLITNRLFGPIQISKGSMVPVQLVEKVKSKRIVLFEINLMQVVSEMELQISHSDQNVTEFKFLVFISKEDACKQNL